MSYLSDFERDFSQRTLKLVSEYGYEKYSTTLLVNCLLGLLIVPKETMLQAVPEVPLTELGAWGINPASIKNPGVRRHERDPDPNTLRGLVFSLRHAVAHFRLKPVPPNETVTAFEFSNQRGLHAVISLDELREFVAKLSDHLRKQ